MENPLIARLRALVALQKFARYWEWDRKVLGLLGIAASTLKQVDYQDDQFMMTTLVLRFMEDQMQAYKES